MINLGRLDIDAQIKDIQDVSIKYSTLKKHLNLYTIVLQARRKIEEMPNKGTNVNLSDYQFIKNLQDKALSLKQSISYFFNSTIFDLKALVAMCSHLIEELIKKDIRNKDQFERFLKLFQGGAIDLHNLINAGLKNDVDFFEKYGEKLGINWHVLLFISDSLTQPFLEEIARKVNASFLENWWKGMCPVCGKPPIIAKIRFETKKRYLTCMLCGAEYLVDLFFCPYCENNDPYTLKFLALDEKPELRIDYCEKCKHYVKVIDENKLKAPIPKGLEDILTLGLDNIAKESGLIR